MSPNRFTAPIVSTKLKAGDEPIVRRDPWHLSLLRPSAWRELREIVDSDLLLEAGDPLRHHFETILAEQLMLLLLEIFGHGIVFVRGHQASQQRKQVGVLARGVRAVHRDERLDRIDQSLSIVAIPAAAGDGLQN